MIQVLSLWAAGTVRYGFRETEGIARDVKCWCGVDKEGGLQGVAS